MGNYGNPIFLHQRMYHHVYSHRAGNLENSALAQHYAEAHPDAEFMQLDVTKIYKTCGYVDRKATEAYIAQTLPNDLNRHEPGNGTVSIDYVW